MNKILLVCSSERGTKVYTDNLRSMGYVHIDTENNGGAARRRLLRESYDLVIIDTPLRDEFGSDVAVKITQTQNSGVILMVKSEKSELISSKVEEYGVFVLPKPFTKSIFHQGIRFVFTSLKRFSIINKEKNKLLKQVDDIKKIDRAKCLLIQYNNMTEEQAHRYLEKQAMDTRLTRREVADKIINCLGV
ncbi:MAG: ANTAR domain-containing protein [Clostridium sp.]|uniref:ANTAR domain-containing response regulator n=1 Tax=Clostridium sp. DSM 8431 TaxID=1761781 RepID=UPI0008ED7B9C|nr:ANTAR domain-containing protein [Clostridium sp. DSM 8431]MCR4943651.1 ANTAR domain-containing protein [Clostridium sp.]SFU49310.1 response regulator receiver and ANTAR domain protein [Clostridium sp. DSM 8431]